MNQRRHSGVVWPLFRRILDPYHQYEPSNPSKNDLKRPSEIHPPSMPYTLLAVAILATVSCLPAGGPGSANRESERRIAAFEAGVTLRHNDPVTAAASLRDAGRGSELERLRVELWFACLERAAAGADAWREFLAQQPPPDLADAARITLARLEFGAGDWDGAAAVLDMVTPGSANEADAVRLLAPDPNTQNAAARRLAVAAPAVLRAAGKNLERFAVGSLTPAERISRAVQWRLDGHPRQSASELRSIKAGGDLEAIRRLELGRSELAAGSTSRALSALPSLSRCTGDEALIRGEAWRRRGWSRFPKKNAQAAFSECMIAARRARTADPLTAVAALELELECASEAGRLDLALDAWRDLAAQGWHGDRRSWLGRRLGVALATAGGQAEAVESLASSLPDDTRCLRFWNGQNGGRVDTSTVTVDDLYGLWRRDDQGMPAPQELVLAAEINPLPPPTSVARLINLGEHDLASQEWRRVRRVSMVPPGEALSAAELELARKRPDLAIRWLRKGFADLGSVSLARSPANAVRSYLPLRWGVALRNAAREAGIEPWLLAGLARQESIFNATARSPAGALGVVQLLPGTARPHARALGLGSRPDLFDPEVNLRLGARELAALLNRFKAVEPALAAYNAGETRARRWYRQWPDPRVFTEQVPIPETYSYIRRVRYLAEAYRLVWAEEWKQGGAQAQNR